MIRQVGSIEIKCTVGEAFEFMTDPRNRLDYDPTLEDVWQTPEGPLAIGTKIVEVRRAIGFSREMHTEVSVFEPHVRVGYRTLDGDPMNAEGYYQFDSVRTGTRLTLHFSMDPQGIIKLASPLIATYLRRNTQIGLRNIKRILERPARLDP